MSEEDKRLLLIDLSARLPYGVKCKPDVKSFIIEYSTLESINKDIAGGFFAVTKDRDIDGNELASTSCDIELVKPYLRSISSMTGKESEEFHSINTGSIRGDMVAKIDFYLKNHFDFRITSEGLSMIEAGLALEAPDGIY